ncbi:hypothetical protein, partial [Xenorhabdus szentirmaii]|uniref:hypothetical protein n=1 Tax=Xenorhabdus szentirmaii TaxID=290112 RepID=UPI002B409FEE
MSPRRPAARHYHRIHRPRPGPHWARGQQLKKKLFLAPWMIQPFDAQPFPYPQHPALAPPRQSTTRRRFP